MQEQYAPCNCPSCASLSHTLPLQTFSEGKSWERILKTAEKAFKKLYQKKKYQPKELFQTPEYQELISQTADVFNQTISYEISEELKSHLQQGNLVFSALKTHAQLTQARSFLTDDKGNITPYYRFEQQVLKLNQTYNRNYLEAEYEFAVQSAQSVQSWQNFSDDTQRYWLEYRTAGDERVRADHNALRGICLPKTDPFWQSYFPPLGWRCRCVAVEVLADENQLANSQKAQELGEKATTQIGVTGKNKLAMFRFNPALDKTLFPPKNSYSTVVGADKVMQEVKQNIRNEFKEEGYIPTIVKEYENGGKIISSNLIDPQGSDYERVLKCCDFFAKQGKETTILPRFNSPLKSNVYKKLYKELQGTPYWGKCPDFKVGNTFYEHEGFLNNADEMNFKKAFKKATDMISKGVKQSDKIIIDYTPCDYKSVKRSIEGRVSKKQKINEVWVLQEKELIRIY